MRNIVGDLKEIRVFAPIGVLEYWSNGGIGQLVLNRAK